MQRQVRAHEIYARGQKQQEEGNLKSGFRLLLEAAKLGDPGAQLNVGYAYDVGKGVRRNRAAAMLWYQKAYRRQRGWGIAASNIGTIFRDEGAYPEAIRWFRRGVRYGDIDANLDLAKIYLENPRQQDKAVACLKDILKATPPVGVGEDTQREARKLLRQIKMKPGA
ncbi:MAG: tetratricopeptide repeat protein [Acidobacteriota bacterium]